jgi:hypothetical protein
MTVKNIDLEPFRLGLAVARDHGIARVLWMIINITRG